MVIYVGGEDKSMFRFVADPNIRTSHPSRTQQTLQTSRAALRKSKPVGPLIEWRTWELFAEYHVTSPPRARAFSEIKIYFIPVQKFKTGHISGAQNKVWHLHAPTTSALSIKSIMKEV